MTNRVVIVTPTYNERENIKRHITTILKQGIPNLSIIIVDDNSPDGTAEIVRSCAASLPVTLIHRPKKAGIGSAYINGFQKAIRMGADFIFEMDADGSHQPETLPAFLNSARNADLVVGSRRIPGGSVRGWNTRRNLQSKAASLFAQRLLNLHTLDVTSGFRCWRSSVFKKIPLNQIRSNGYSFQLEILWWCERLGFSVKEIPIHFVDRRHGKSKLSPKEIFLFFSTVARLKFNAPPTN